MRNDARSLFSIKTSDKINKRNVNLGGNDVMYVKHLKTQKHVINKYNFIV